MKQRRFFCLFMGLIAILLSHIIKSSILKLDERIFTVVNVSNEIIKTKPTIIRTVDCIIEPLFFICNYRYSRSIHSEAVLIVSIYRSDDEKEFFEKNLRKLSMEALIIDRSLMFLIINAEADPPTILRQFLDAYNHGIENPIFCINSRSKCQYHIRKKNIIKFAIAIQTLTLDPNFLSESCEIKLSFGKTGLNASNQNYMYLANLIFNNLAKFEDLHETLYRETVGDFQNELSNLLLNYNVEAIGIKMRFNSNYNSYINYCWEYVKSMTKNLDLVVDGFEYGKSSSWYFEKNNKLYLLEQDRLIYSIIILILLFIYNQIINYSDSFHYLSQISFPVFVLTLAITSTIIHFSKLPLLVNSLEVYIISLTFNFLIVLIGYFKFRNFNLLAVINLSCKILMIERLFSMLWSEFLAGTLLCFIIIPYLIDIYFGIFTTIFLISYHNVYSSILIRLFNENLFQVWDKLSKVSKDCVKFVTIIHLTLININLNFLIRKKMFANKYE